MSLRSAIPSGATDAGWWLKESICAGELVCLQGPNGAGKSTLLRTLAGMQRPLTAQVRLLGACLHDLTRATWRIA